MRSGSTVWGIQYAECFTTWQKTFDCTNPNGGGANTNPLYKHTCGHKTHFFSLRHSGKLLHVDISISLWAHLLSGPLWWALCGTCSWDQPSDRSSWLLQSLRSAGWEGKVSTVQSLTGTGFRDWCQWTLVHTENGHGCRWMEDKQANIKGNYSYVIVVERNDGFTLPVFCPKPPKLMSPKASVGTSRICLCLSHDSPVKSSGLMASSTWSVLE